MQSRSYAHTHHSNMCVCIPIRNMKSDLAFVNTLPSCCKHQPAICSLYALTLLPVSLYVRHTAVSQSLMLGNIPQWDWTTTCLASPGWCSLGSLPVSQRQATNISDLLRPVDCFPRVGTKSWHWWLLALPFKIVNAYLPTWGCSTLSSPPPGKTRVWVPRHPSPPDAFLQSEFNTGDHFNQCWKAENAKGKHRGSSCWNEGL